MKLKIDASELEIMPYDDIAYEILKIKNGKMKIAEIFKIICDNLNMTEKQYDEQITDFFALMSTEKRFIQLENGFLDLREKYTSKDAVKVLNDDEDEEIEEKINTEEPEEVEQNEEDAYYDDTKDNEDEETEDDLKDLLVIDAEEETDL